MEIDIAHIIEAIVALAGIVTTILTYMGKTEEVKKVHAVVDGVEHASKVMNSEEAKALKKKIHTAAESLGVADALHRVVKGREKQGE